MHVELLIEFGAIGSRVPGKSFFAVCEGRHSDCLRLS